MLTATDTLPVVERALSTSRATVADTHLLAYRPIPRHPVPPRRDSGAEQTWLPRLRPRTDPTITFFIFLSLF